VRHVNALGRTLWWHATMARPPDPAKSALNSRVSAVVRHHRTLRVQVHPTTD